MKSLLLVLCLLTSVTFGQNAWTNQSPAGLSDDIWCVSFANDTFVAVTSKGKVLTSSDGLSWGVQTVAQGVWLVSATYGAGLWVVVGDGGSIYYSADVRTWVAARSITTERINGVCHTGKTFIAVTEQGSVLTSVDAQTWKIKTGVSRSTLHGLAVVSPSATQNTVYASGGQGVIVFSNDEGLNWSSYVSYSLQGRAQPPPTDYIEALAVKPPVPGVSGNLLAAVGGNAFSAAFPNIYGGSLYGSYRSLTPRVYLRGLTYGAGSFVAAGDLGVIFTSPDGSTWTQRYSSDSPGSPNTAMLLGAEYAETLQRFVVVGIGGTILVSNAAPSTLINVSTRATVAATDPLIGGFVVAGTARKYVLIRAVGPTLATFGVPQTLADPVMRVYDARNVVVASNTGWSTNANRNALVVATARSTFPLPEDSRDSAVYLSLEPGAYTVQVTSASNRTGTVLFEAYSP